MKHLLNYKTYIKESLEEEISILKELSLDLTDKDLSVTISTDDPRFHFKDSIYMVVDDVNKIFCKNYPKDDMDWLNNKPIMLDFFKKLDEFGLKRDVDYKVYGGGTGVTLVFSKKGRKSIKL